MSLIKRILGITQNIDEFLEKAKREEQKNIIFSLEETDVTEEYMSGAQKYRVRMYLSYENYSKKTKVFETTSDLFILAGVLSDQRTKLHEFDKSVLRQRNRVREKVIGAGFSFEDPTQYKQDPLLAGV